jgi:hypothetical protein
MKTRNNFFDSKRGREDPEGLDEISIDFQNSVLKDDSILSPNNESFMGIRTRQKTALSTINGQNHIRRKIKLG